MSEKKYQKSIEELCRSRLSRTAGGEKWPLAKKSSHRLFRSPSPRESCTPGSRRSGNPRHSLLTSRPLSTELNPGGSTQHSVHEAEKRKLYQSSHDAIKKLFFPGIPPQVVTHADPPFPGSDTQPLPPINMPKGQDNSNLKYARGPLLADHASTFSPVGIGKDNRPFTIFGQMPFDGGVAYDIIFAANEERAGKRKLEAIKRPELQEKHERNSFDASRKHRDHERRGRKKCGGKKKGRRGRKFPKPLSWKSPWPEQDGDSDTDVEWTDIN